MKPRKEGNDLLERRQRKREAQRAADEGERARQRDEARARLAKGHLSVDPARLAPNGSYSTPEFVTRGHYVDLPFVCKACGAAQVWTEAQQKWWFEVAQGDVWTTAILCRPCRRREQARKRAARAVHLEGLATKQAKRVRSPTSA